MSGNMHGFKGRRFPNAYASSQCSAEGSERSASVHNFKGRRHLKARSTAYDNASQCSTESSDQYGSDLRSPDIGQRVHSLYKNQLYTDVKFVISCGVKPKPHVLAHKAILAIGSPKFAEMLYTSSKPTSEQDVIQINNIPFHAFSSLIEYLYTDDVYFESDTQVMDILSTAKVFEVNTLETRCETYIESSEITETNVCTKFQLATTHKMESMKQRCIEFIQENTSAVLNSFNFKTSDQSTVRNICKLPNLNLRSEQELFHAVMEWIEEKPVPGKSKRELLEPFLRHIRLLTMPSRDFNELVSRNPNIFTAEEALNIFMYLTTPIANRQSSKLPSWCNKAGNRCLTKQGLQYPRENRSSSDRMVSISLIPCQLAYANYVMCMIELKCNEGYHRIKALKLRFGEPLAKDSTIDRLIITVSTEPSKFTFKEHLKVHHSSQVIVPFTRLLLARGGDTVYIQAEATDVRNYKFLKFDEENSLVRDSPFVCSVGSRPKERRLFFISEVIFEDAPSRNRQGPDPRRRC